MSCRTHLARGRSRSKPGEEELAPALAADLGARVVSLDHPTGLQEVLRLEHRAGIAPRHRPASDEERLVRFLNLSGLTPRGLRATATQPESLGAVLDYLLAWEPLLMSFSDELGVAPEIIAHTRQKLPGAPLLN